MKTAFLRFWYRITGQKATAEHMLQLAKMLDYYTDTFTTTPQRRMMDKWEREFGHIYRLFNQP